MNFQRMELEAQIWMACGEMIAMETGKFIAGMQPQTYSFADGVLNIDVPLAKVRLRWRPEPQAEELAPGMRKWRACRPEFRLLSPTDARSGNSVYVLDVPGQFTGGIAKQKAEAFAAFRKDIPDDIVRIVEPFGSHQWALMVLVQAEPWAKELALGNPVLAYALANSDKFRGSPPEAAAVQARWYCHKKQRELLEWLGFPGTEPVARLIRKILPESASPAFLYRLNHALKADKRVLEYLSRLKVINAAVLELVTILPYLDLITPNLLMEVANEPAGVLFADMIHGGLAILQQITPHPNIKPFASVKQVRGFREAVATKYRAYLHRQELLREEARLHADRERQRQRMVEMADRRMRYELRRKNIWNDFPPPPIPGTKDIIPLTSYEQLYAEGNDQVHCVASYHRRVLLGSTYVYRILAPERATLAIVRGTDDRWYRSELNGKGNSKVNSATEKMVDMWLEKVSICRRS